MKNKVAMVFLFAWSFVYANDGMEFEVSPELTTTGGAATEQLLRQLELQYFYLKHLDNVRQAMEQELSIAKIRRECEQLHMVCTGDGLIDLPPPSPPLPEVKPGKSDPPPVLPVVRGVAGGGAWVDHRRQRFYVERGMRVGAWMVDRIALDHLVFERDGQRFTVPVQWQTDGGDPQEAR